VHGTSNSTHSGRADSTSIPGTSRAVASARLTVSTRRGGSMGFERKSYACPRRALSAVSVISTPVMTMIFEGLGFAVQRAKTSSPPIPGNRMSSSTTPKSCASIFSSASAPSFAYRGPALLKAYQTFRVASSSSTISTR
jgi:hypothetical protein